ncbi:hypothetical protein DsansV1_C08g0085551 [Dioscorea sansibarensis]
MARKWQKVVAIARRISSPRANDHSDFSACSTASRALLSSMFIDSPSTCSTFSVQNTQQLTICSF